MAKTNIKSSELLDNVVQDYKVLEGYVSTGDLLHLLNASASFTFDQVHSLIFSFNQFKNNTNNPKFVKEVFIMILNSCFIFSAVEPIIKQYLFKNTTKENLETMIHFFFNCIELLPNQAVKKMSLLCSCVLYVSRQHSDYDLEVACQSLKNYIEDFKNKQKVEKETIKMLPQVKNGEVKVEGNVEVNVNENICIIPEYCDIFPSFKYDPSKTASYDKELSGSNIKAEYVDDYLHTQFTLLKEEYIKPLKEVVNMIRTNFTKKSSLCLDKYEVKLHEGIIIDDLYPSHKGLVYRVHFDIKRFNKSFNWEKSCIFSPGSLLCFTNNIFDSLHFGSIVESTFDTLSKGILLVQFNEDPIHDLISNSKFIMIETKIMYEIFYDILRRSFSNKPSLFIERFALKDTVSKSPAFLIEDDLTKMKTFFDENMDNCKIEIFSNVMQNNLSLIKGKECTGKTFLCIKMIKYILTNYEHKKLVPILVICNTDDALDHFVFDSYNIIGIKDIVKVGGSFLTNILRDCDISTIKGDRIRKNDFPNNFFVRAGKNRRKTDEYEECLCRKCIEILNCSRSLLSFNEISGQMLPNHIRYFEDKDFYNWVTDLATISYVDLTKYTESTQQILRDTFNSDTEDIIKRLLFDIVIKILEELDEGEDGMVQSADQGPPKSPNLFRQSANIKFIIYGVAVESLREGEFDHLESLDVDFTIRIKLYRYWLNKYREILLKQYECDQRIYDNLRKEKEQLLFEEYELIMKNVKVIVMTSALAVKYGEVLDKIRPRIVMVKEAEKLLESRILSLLTENCQQLILFGNDETPSNDIITPRKCIASNEEVSLFQKLIKSNYKYYTLQRQYQRIYPGQCNMKLTCGHLCTWLSHTNMSIHNDYKCIMPCIKTCERGVHPCKLLCYEDCLCKEKVDIELMCGHSKNISCLLNNDLEPCIETCAKKLNCGHYCLKICGKSCKCSEIMKETLTCGHVVEFQCGELSSHLKCLKLCQRKMICGHVCSKKCHERCVCVQNVEYTLPCRHTIKLKCGSDISNYLCAKDVTTMLPCGHTTIYICFEGFSRCKHKKFTSLACGHNKLINCGELTSNIICTEKCLKDLQHNSKYCHKCKLNCHSGSCPPCKESHKKVSCLIM